MKYQYSFTGEIFENLVIMKSILNKLIIIIIDSLISRINIYVKCLNQL